MSLRPTRSRAEVQDQQREVTNMTLLTEDGQDVELKAPQAAQKECELLLKPGAGDVVQRSSALLFHQIKVVVHHMGGGKT